MLAVRVLSLHSWDGWASTLQDKETSFVPCQFLFEQAEPGLPSAPTGGVPRNMKGEIRLPPLPPPDDPPPDSPVTGEEVQRTVEEQMSPSMETPGDAFPSLGGGGTPFNTPIAPTNFGAGRKGKWFLSWKCPKGTLRKGTFRTLLEIYFCL